MGDIAAFRADYRRGHVHQCYSDAALLAVVTSPLPYITCPVYQPSTAAGPLGQGVAVTPAAVEQLWRTPPTARSTEIRRTQPRYPDRVAPGAVWESVQ